MNGFNIPLPQGLAGAPPGYLQGAGDILGGAMQTQGVPDRTGGAGAATGGAATGGQPWWYTSPDMMDFVAEMARIGYDAATAAEALEYEARRDDADRAQEYELAQQELAAAIEAANIAANASKAAAQAHAAATTEAARINAEAAMYSADQALAAAKERSAAARYAADQALEGVRLDTETRMKIAAGNLRLEAQKVAATEFQSPSDWIGQVGFLRGMGMTRADVTPQAIQATGEMLGPGPPDLGPAPQQAIVGEPGPYGQPQPELLTATPQGTQVTPLGGEEAYWLRGKVPSMQYGGRVSFSRPSSGQGFYGAPAGGMIKKAQRGELHPALASRVLAAPGGLPGGSQLVTRQQAQGEMPAWFSQWLETQGGAGGGVATLGTAGAGPTQGGPGGAKPITDTTGTATTANEMPFLETLRSGAYVPLYEAWGGERTLPEAGITDPIKMPHEYNYADFARWLPTEQSMMFATWRALGMEPTTALEIMRRSAPRGTAGAGVAYG